MNEIGHWATLSLEHLKERWEPYIMPTLVFFAVVMVGALIMFGFITIAPILLIFPMIGLQQAVGPEAAEEAGAAIALTATLGSFGLTLAGVLGSLLIFAPLQLRFFRGTLKMLRGESFDVGDLFHGQKGDVVRSVGLTVLLVIVMIPAALLFYVPALLLSVFVIFALPAMADRDLGPIDAIKWSFEMVKGRFIPLLVYSLMISVVISIAGMVPVVGSFAAIPISSVMMMIAYQGVNGELPPAPGSGQTSSGGPGQPSPPRY